jgi:hypothetical protein
MATPWRPVNHRCCLQSRCQLLAASHGKAAAMHSKNGKHHVHGFNSTVEQGKRRHSVSHSLKK